MSQGRRLVLSTPRFVLLCAGAMAILNLPLLELLFANLAVRSVREAVFVASLPVAWLALNTLVLSALLTGAWSRATAAALFVANALLAYFAEAYGVVMSSDLVRNVVESNAAEAGELVTPGLLAFVALFGGLPALGLWWLELAPAGGRRERWQQRLRLAAGALLALLAVAVPLRKDYVRFASAQPQAFAMLTPHNYLAGFVVYGVQLAAEAEAPFEPIGLDARDADAGRGPRSVVILAVGETARAANFSLYGYGRATDPELAARGAIALRGATACGTYTAWSLPCMFSNLTARQFDLATARSRGNLLDVAAAAGVHVVWRDNDSGCKGVCDRVAPDPTYAPQIPGLCQGVQCLDDVLLRGLDRLLDAAAARDSDSLVVLHLMGSHGPTYYARYPPAFARFLPSCETNRIRECEPQALVNAYDNSILYTDAILARVVDLLAARRDRLAGSLVYVSDHGESLGEDGLFLHGSPRETAPREQLEVPFLYWLSPEARAKGGLDEACLRRRAHEGGYSHDNLFHSVLGLLGVETVARDPRLDLFAGCSAGDRRGATS